MPNWYAVLLLAGAAYRIFWFLSEDALLDSPRRYVTRLGDKWKKDGDPLPRAYREKLATFLNCPWCLGFWVSFLLWGLWEIWPHATLAISALLTVSTLVGLAHRTED